MDSNFHFGPARTGERTAYGARTPDASPAGILEWADFMRSQGVTRVCCLLDAGQLAGFPVNLEAEYKRLFGATCVLMEPIADHHLCSRQALRRNILPFLRTADTGVMAALHVSPLTTTTPSNTMITNMLSDWDHNSSLIVPNFGDYTDNAVSATGSAPYVGKTLYVAWSDGRLGIPQPFEAHVPG